VTGKILETLNAAGYTYIKLQTSEGETWVAVPATPATVGSEVAVVNPMTMTNFESKTLGRKFDTILFGTLASGEAEAHAPSGPPPLGGAGHGIAATPRIAATPPADLGPIKVARADGAEGRTIAEVYAEKAALRDKSVAIRGRVVKFTSGVLGRNWVHVRDGSGSDVAKDNDITATTMDTAAVGDVVLIQGALHLDRDFGAGYSYSVIIEGATVAK